MNFTKVQEEMFEFAKKMKPLVTLLKLTQLKKRTAFMVQESVRRCVRVTRLVLVWP